MVENWNKINCNPNDFIEHKNYIKNINANICIIKIKKEMFRKFTHYLTKKEIDEVHKAFKLFDQDGSGSISIRVTGFT